MPPKNYTAFVERVLATIEKMRLAQKLGDIILAIVHLQYRRAADQYGNPEDGLYRKVRDRFSEDKERLSGPAYEKELKRLHRKKRSLEITLKYREPRVSKTDRTDEELGGAPRGGEN